jgi:cysteine synthase
MFMLLILIIKNDIFGVIFSFLLQKVYYLHMSSCRKVVSLGNSFETPLKKIPLLGNKNLWVKDESVNPTGTHKDRLAQEILKIYQQLLKINPDVHGAALPACSLISAGNAAIAIASLLKKQGLPKLRVLIDRSAEKKKIEVLQKYHCQIFTTDFFSKSLSTQDILYLTNNSSGFDLTSYTLINNSNYLYDDLVLSILKAKPDTIIVPYGSGDLFESFCRNIIRLQKNNNNEKLIKLIGVTTHNENSKADKLFSAYAPFDHNNERLNFLKIFNYIDKGSEIYSIGERYLDHSVKYLQDQNISSEHSGAAGVAYMLEENVRCYSDKRCIIVNTGQGLLSREMEL